MNMKSQSPHHHHDDISRRLKRANGHLQTIISMIEAEKPCVDIAQQLHAVENAVRNAKVLLVQDHIDHCLEDAVDKQGKINRAQLSEFKKITKYL